MKKEQSDHTKLLLQNAGLLILFLLAQIVAGFLTLLLSNIPHLISGEEFDAGLLQTSAPAIGISMILSGIITVTGMAVFSGIRTKDFTRNGNPGSVYGYTVLLMLPAIFIINLCSEFLSLTDINRELFEQLMYSPWGVIAIVLTGPFTEELVFRMGIQRHFIRLGLSPATAILSTSVLFGLIHLNPAQMPGAIAFGLILGWLYQRSGSIWIPVAAHTMNNLTGVLSVWFMNNPDQTLTELCGGTWQTVLCALLSLILFTYSFQELQRRFSTENRNK